MKELTHFVLVFPANIYLLKVNNRNTGKKWDICSKLIIKTPERRPWRSATFSKVAVKAYNFTKSNTLTSFWCFFC